MVQNLVKVEVKDLYDSTLQVEENTMAKMSETLEDIIHTTETMMDAVKEISDIVNN